MTKIKIISQGEHYREVVELRSRGGVTRSRTYHQIKLNGSWVNRKDYTRKEGRWILNKSDKDKRDKLGA